MTNESDIYLFDPIGWGPCVDGTPGCISLNSYSFKNKSFKILGDQLKDIILREE